MYFYIEKTKGKRIDEGKRRNEFIPTNERTIKRGEKVLVFSNGTIGKGARSLNYSKKEAVKILKALIRELDEV
jgi:glutamate 5-kinase